jgi:hypothetical protein
MRSAEMGNNDRRPETYPTTPITASVAKLVTSSTTMSFDWMLNLDSSRPCRRLPLLTGTG